MKKISKKNISNIKKKYFLKNPEITIEQIQKLLENTKDYLIAVNLNYETKVKQSILQSTISLITLHQNLESKQEE